MKKVFLAVALTANILSAAEHNGKAPRVGWCDYLVPVVAFALNWACWHNSYPVEEYHCTCTQQECVLRSGSSIELECGGVICCLCGTVTCCCLTKYLAEQTYNDYKKIKKK